VVWEGSGQRYPAYTTERTDGGTVVGAGRMELDAVARLSLWRIGPAVHPMQGFSLPGQGDPLGSLRRRGLRTLANIQQEGGLSS